MQYLVSNDNRWLASLKRWLPKGDTPSTLQALEAWAVSNETAWGHCLVSGEVVFPWNKARQADLLIAFDDRIAICEVKTQRVRDILSNVGGYVLTISEMQKSLKSRLATQGVLFAPDATPAAVIFCRQLDQTEIHEVRDTFFQRGHPQVAIAGEIGPQAYRNDLATVLKQRLNRPQARRAPSLAVCTQALIEHQLLSFLSLGDLVLFLNQRITGLDYLTSDPWYIPELRQHEYDDLREALRTHRFAEVVAEPGLGKSALIKHYLRNFDRPCSPLSLNDCRSLDKVIRRLYRGLFGNEPHGLGLLQQLAELDSTDGFIWIESYDIVSRPAVAAFLEFVRGNRPLMAASGRTRWIIESLTAIEASDIPSISLSRFSSSALSQILERTVRPSAIDVGEVIARANGNPGLAIAMAREPGTAAISPTTPNHFDWFLGLLSHREKTLLQVLVVLASSAPLGFSQKLLETAGSGVLHVDVKLDTEALVGLLERFGYIRVYRFEPAELDPTPDKTFANVAPTLTFLDGLNQHLADYVSAAIPAGSKTTWLQSLRRHLEDHWAVEFVLSEVTFSLLDGDIWPFFRSAFRHTNTHRDGVLDWISRHQDFQVRPGQEYLIEALELLSRLASDSDQENSNTLKEPDPENPQQVYAFGVVQARLRGKTGWSHADVRNWIEWANSVSDGDLRVEILIRATEVLRSQEKFTEAWAVLQELLQERPSLSPAARGLLYWHVYAFLNRKKDAERAGLDGNRIRDEILKHLPDFVSLSAESENIRSLCNALFYYARDIEYQASRNQSKLNDALETLQALEFVEQASPSRRVQAILTQGSVHRHCCRKDKITWTEFEEHLRSGLLHYKRAYRSAIFVERNTHRLNSASYMGDICRLGLRFRVPANAVTSLANFSRDTIPYLMSTIADLATERALGPDDRQKLENVKYVAVVLAYVSAAVTNDSTSHELLHQSLDVELRSRTRSIISGQGPSHKRHKAGRSFLLDLERLLLLTKPCTNDRMASYRDSFSLVLEEATSFAAQDERTQGAWVRLSNAVGGGS